MAMPGGCNYAIIITQPSNSTWSKSSCWCWYPPMQCVVQVLELVCPPHHIAQPLQEAAADAHTQLGVPAELTQPASDAHTCTDHVAQLMSDIAAVQLPQQQLMAEPEAHAPCLDCQGLQLLSSDRLLHWEAFVREQLVPAAGGNTVTACKFLDDAALADCKAYGLTSGTVPDPNCLFPCCCCTIVRKTICCYVCHVPTWMHKRLILFVAIQAASQTHLTLSSAALLQKVAASQTKVSHVVPPLLYCQVKRRLLLLLDQPLEWQTSKQSYAGMVPKWRTTLTYACVSQTASCTESATWLHASCYGCGRTTCRGFMKPTWL